MKERLGFGDQPEWQDDYYPEDQYSEQTYDDGYYPEEGGYDQEGYEASSSATSFSSYDPSTFEHVTLNSGSRLQAASLGDSNDSYFNRRNNGYSPYGSTPMRSTRDNVRSINDRPSRSTNSSSDWGAPADPSFLDNPAPKYDRDIHEYSPTQHASSGSDLYSQFDTDVKMLHGNPASHIEIVRPTAYADVQKIATAVKGSKTVVLVLGSTDDYLAKRILDFSFGVATALDGTVDKLAGKTFAISKSSAPLSQQALSYLKEQGVLA